MRSSEFMDKQIMDLYRSKSDDFLGFSSLRDREVVPEDDDDRASSVNEDEFFPSFQFRPAQPASSPWSRSSTLRQSSAVDHVGRARDGRWNGGTCFDTAALISVIDRKMKEHTENVLHAVESVSARLCQLETRSRQMENSIDELKDSLEFKHGRTDKKLNELENLLREVQCGVNDLKDKQEIAEAQLQLAKIQLSEARQQYEKQNSSVQSNSSQGAVASVPPQTPQPQPVPVSFSQQLPSSSHPFPPPPYHQNPIPPPAATAIQLPSQLPQNLVSSVSPPESYYQSDMLRPESAHMQYQTPSSQQSQPQYPTPQQPFLPTPPPPSLSQFSYLPEPNLPLSQVNPQIHTSSIQPQELSHLPNLNLPPNIPKSSNLPFGMPPIQQFNEASNQWIHDGSSSYHYLGSSPGHVQRPGQPSFDDHYYSGLSSTYSASASRPSQLPTSDSVLHGSSSQSRLPTVQIPYALPMASVVDGGSESDRAASNNTPLDDTVDQVVAMGFRRDLVRAMVRKMSEKGQPVDVNKVLDNLTNDG